MSEKASMEENAKVGSRQETQARYVPPLWVWTVVACCLAVITWMRRTDAVESGLANVLTFLMAVLAVFSVVFWFTLFSGHRRPVRWLPAAVLVFGLAIAVGLVEVSGFSGAMIPSFRWRGSDTPDEQLDGLSGEQAVAGVDLSITAADDFPQFLGRDRRATVGHVTLSRDWSAHPPIEKWRQPIGAGWSGFVAVNGFAVTMEQRGSTEATTCYDLRTGQLRWAHGIEARHETKLGGIGPRSTPTIDEGRVYALGATGVLRCLDGASGGELWSHNLLSLCEVTLEEDIRNVAWGRSASPLIVDHMVIVPLGGPASGRKVSLVAFDKVSGEKVWEGGQNQISYASPDLAAIAGTRQIVIVNESSVTGHAIEDGRVLWEHPWPGSSNTNASTSQALALPGDRIFVSKGYGFGAELFQLSPRESGLWQTESLWSKPVMKTKLTNVVIHQDHVYGLDDGILSCVELETGRRRWKQGRYGHGQVLLVGDIMLVQSETGELLLVPASPARHEVLGQIQALEGKSWNNVCLYGPYLLLRNGEEAACYELTLETRVTGVPAMDFAPRANLPRSPAGPVALAAGPRVWATWTAATDVE